MKVKNLLAVLLFALAAGCGGGGGGDSGGGAKPSASQAFVAAVQSAAATEADEIEPTDFSATAEASDDDVEPSVI